MNVEKMLTDEHKKILLQLYYEPDYIGTYNDGSKWKSIYLPNGIKYKGKVLTLWGGCDKHCECGGKTCGGNKFASLGRDSSRNEEELKSDLGDLINLGLIEQRKGDIYFTPKGLNLFRGI